MNSDISADLVSPRFWNPRAKQRRTLCPFEVGGDQIQARCTTGGWETTPQRTQVFTALIPFGINPNPYTLPVY